MPYAKAKKNRKRKSYLELFNDQDDSFSQQYFGEDRKKNEVKFKKEHKERHKRQREKNKKDPYHLEVVDKEDELGSLL